MESSSIWASAGAVFNSDDEQIGLTNRYEYTTESPFVEVNAHHKFTKVVHEDDAEKVGDFIEMLNKERFTDD